jgi:D-alanyl-D-alanine carboxypeptidase (penicillin-binding protein 5/6)
LILKQEVKVKVATKFSLLIWISIIVSLSGAPTYGADASKTLQVQAPSAILTDAVTGQVLYARGENVRRPIASTTKIMTAILTIENCGMDDVVTASENASKVPFTSLHLKPGEQIKVKDLLEALLIRSANDSAVALAEHIGGTVDGFAQMMNDKAQQIGAKDTHFVNPNGLYVEGHYSTAHDLALITRYALRLPIFNEIIAMRHARIQRSMNVQDVYLATKSTFIKKYQGADGVKSGYIREAGYCFVGSATRGGWRLVSVVLKSPDSQGDTCALMDYGFSNYRRLVLADRGRPVEKIAVSGGASEVDVVPSQRLHVAIRAGNSSSAKTEVHLDDQIHAPIKKGDKVGTMTAYVDGKAVYAVELEAANDVDESLVSAAWPWLRTITLLGMVGVGVACGRASTKNNGGGRGRLS